MNLSINISVDDNCSLSDLKDDIISEAAKQMLNEVMRNQDHYGRSFRDKLTETIIAMITENLDEDLKLQITEKAKNEIVKKYIKTKQYRELKNELDICSDSEIESGLKKIVTDIVRKEMKNMFSKTKW